ncbi:CDP-diacylglycerol--glycerol-3-phosphate 3-phosphatidyltransferase [Pseudonocardia thermophila]|jgi:CDP-diacylglycerol--glycerol-3-phosphate 3-phosphatidyltransferase|uniref:CDP-diacylglycerol--glycerol-3-phosphate 3-phosphatidyltransferase n=1 Tax=Pseudonocardia thermophila TaxID=1848 RepID=A0A1M6QXY2_PSETH|nr:CDP-diacylglycerol--glycerol-3-phosphate 3-phosphatidyltransferase [Pseudonocardia thermophila]SHK25036.1 CDP-diacylglycerol--glycerol-3-phosphate 3-phosphatidyltransferase [Pseudonocardia thermophila]
MSSPTGAEPPPVLNIANVLTVLRLLLVPVFAWALFAHSGQDVDWRLGAFTIFVAAAVTDRFDGELARRRGLVTAFGTIADPIADKALMGTALMGLSALHLLPWWITVVILGREIGITLLRFAVLRHGIIPASRGGKAKTLVQTVAIGLYVLPLPELVGGSDLVEGARWALMMMAVVLTVATGIDYVLRAIRLRSAAPAG